MRQISIFDRIKKRARTLFWAIFEKTKIWHSVKLNYKITELLAEFKFSSTCIMNQLQLYTRSCNPEIWKWYLNEDMTV